jgi:AcrR family transcriptional regulator
MAASKPERRDTRAKLLEVARALWVEEGAAQVSLRDVARRAKVSPAAVYRHFESKEALLGAVCAAGFQMFGAYLMGSLVAKTERARLAAASVAYRRFALENPEFYRVMFMGALPSSAVSPIQPVGETFQFLVDRVRECQRAKVIHAGDATSIAASIWAHVHGLVSLRLTGHMDQVGTDADFEKFFDRSSDELVSGLGPKGKKR